LPKACCPISTRYPSDSSRLIPRLARGTNVSQPNHEGLMTRIVSRGWRGEGFTMSSNGMCRA
jgi:hypothetical protein